jgi:hypothetical protein
MDAGQNIAASMMNNSSAVGNPTAEKKAHYALLGMTAVTGLVDACQFPIARARLHGEHDGECRDSGVCDSTRTRTVHRVLLNGAHVVSSRGDVRRTDHGPSRRRLTDSIRGTSVPAGRHLSLCRVLVRHRIQTRLARTFFSTMFLGAALGAIIIRYSTSAALWLGTAISALCSAALFRALRNAR